MSATLFDAADVELLLTLLKVPTPRGPTASTTTRASPTRSTPTSTVAPAGTSSGKRLRVRGMGVKTSTETGDLYAEVQIVLPESLPVAPAAAERPMREEHRLNTGFTFTNFVNGSTNTFPTWVFGASRLGEPPQVNVWGTVLFTAGIIVAVLQVVRTRRSRPAA